MTSLHEDYIVRSAKLHELAKAVKEMRKLQRNYFSSRSKTVLAKAIKQESLVDSLLTRIDC